jgi:chromosome partitioning protein
MTNSPEGLGWPDGPPAATRAAVRDDHDHASADWQVRARIRGGAPEAAARGLGWPEAGDLDGNRQAGVGADLGYLSASSGLGSSAGGSRGLPAPTGDAPESSAVGDQGTGEPDALGAQIADRGQGAVAHVSRETGRAAQAPHSDERRDGSSRARWAGGAGDQVREREVPVVLPVTPGASVDTPIARAAQAAVVARSGGDVWPRPASCRVITIANQKGGVGKTTTGVNLAAALSMHGSRVLVVDLDPQGNASTALDVDHRSGVPSMYDVLVDDRPMVAVIRPVEGYAHLYCAPASIDLAGAEIELVPLVARESRLARSLASYDASNLDYILIDCPPSLGLLTVNALVAAPEVLIPIQCEYYALEGLEQLLRTIDLVRSHLNPKLSVTTILLTMYDSRTRLASQVADEVRDHFGSVVLRSVIPRSVRVSEAPSYGQSVMTYDPGSSGALAYLAAARELAGRNVPMPA